MHIYSPLNAVSLLGFESESKAIKCFQPKGLVLKSQACVNSVQRQIAFFVLPFQLLPGIDALRSPLCSGKTKQHRAAGSSLWF